MAFLLYNRLSADIQFGIVKQLDFYSLMMFRTTSHAGLDFVRRELLDAMDELLQSHVPDAALFKLALVQHGALVGGIAALRIFLRLRPAIGEPLEVYVPSGNFVAMRGDLIVNQTGVDVGSAGMPYAEGLQQVVAIKTIHGKLHVYESTGAAILPIVHAPNTALAVYVSPAHFGMGWPKLTLQKRCMPGSFTRGFRILNEAVSVLGFNIKLWPWMWSSLGLRPQACTRELFCCPGQERTVADSGFLRLTLSPLDTPRFEANVAFRLCDRPCRGGCHGPGTYLRSEYSMMAEY